MAGKKIIRVETPLTEDAARALRVGDSVLINGIVLTARDKVHKHLVNKRPNPGDIPFELAGAVLYHAGPLMKEEDGKLEVVAAGPTTSQRMQMYEPFVIRHYGIRGIIGKGGMTGDVIQAMQEAGAVYFHAIGGAGALLAGKIKKIEGVWMLEEFGRAEAMWAFRVEDFPAVVTIDTTGASLHDQVEKLSQKRLEGLLST
ncbi:MAG: FumA C-terminus/TtdB family hydratase beta subunit [Nitrospiraceae bacterium]|nr:FumA C-terminus/TtdB family hydratase beta subunit [Nitrospiraceae bacterium]